MAGTLLGGGLLAAVTFAFIEGGHRGLGAPVLVAIAAALVLTVAFIVVERAREDPVLPLALLRRPVFTTANLVAGTMNLATLGLLFVPTLYLQDVRDDSALIAGLALLPLFVPLSALAPLTGRVGPRWPMAAAIGAVPAARSGLASAVNNTARQAGGAIGIAAFGGLAGAPKRNGLPLGPAHPKPVHARKHPGCGRLGRSLGAVASHVRAPARPSADTALPPAAVRRAIGLALGPAVALGLARFAYALLLPAMRSDLDWSYAQAGAINTANAVGYLVGAVLATGLTTWIGARRTFVAGLVVTTLAVLASAASGALAVLAALRLVAGAAGAFAFIGGAALVAQLASGGVARRGPLLLGIYISGAGAGIAASGALVPAVLSAAGAGGWRAGWLVLGALAVGGTAVAALTARRAACPPASPEGQRSGGSPGRLAPVGLGYGLFGAGYIAYATFIIAYLRGQGLGATEVSVFWIVLGLAAVVAAFAWHGVLERLRGGRGPATVIAVATLGAALPLVSTGMPAALASALLFGGSFLTVVAAVTELARRTVPPHAITAAIGALTIAFALGQCAGPLLAGVLSDGPAGVRAGLALSAAILAAGALVSLLQRERVYG